MTPVEVLPCGYCIVECKLSDEIEPRTWAAVHIIIDRIKPSIGFPPSNTKQYRMIMVFVKSHPYRSTVMSLPEPKYKTMRKNWPVSLSIVSQP